MQRTAHCHDQCIGGNDNVECRRFNVTKKITSCALSNDSSVSVQTLWEKSLMINRAPVQATQNVSGRVRRGLHRTDRLSSMRHDSLLQRCIASRLSTFLDEDDDSTRVFLAAGISPYNKHICWNVYRREAANEVLLVREKQRSGQFSNDMHNKTCSMFK
jgi:hypothetical protein